MTATLEDYRQFYAEEIAVVAGIRSKALTKAFATVPRELFLGPGPWKLASSDLGSNPDHRYRLTEDADPRRIYHNVLVSLDESRHLNNGQPTALAAWIDALDIREGDHVMHLGAGVGYFTAIIAEVVGPKGRVTALEVDPDLAARARANLKNWKNVAVVSGDGAEYDPGPVDAIFVNAGITHPSALWLDRLKAGARLLYPLTFETAGMSGGKGCMVLVKREGDAYLARPLGFVMIFSCTSLRDPELNAALPKQLGSMKIFSARSLRRDPHQAEESCLVHSKDSCLSSLATGTQSASV